MLIHLSNLWLSLLVSGFLGCQLALKSKLSKCQHPRSLFWLAEGTSKVALIRHPVQASCACFPSQRTFLSDCSCEVACSHSLRDDGFNTTQSCFELLFSYTIFLGILANRWQRCEHICAREVFTCNCLRGISTIKCTSIRKWKRIKFITYLPFSVCRQTYCIASKKVF